MALFTHWNGCIQFLIAGLENYPSDSWVVRAGLQHEDATVQWSWSFYHAASQMIAIADVSSE